MRCVSFCTARSYNLPGISNFYKGKEYQARLYRNVLYIRHIEKAGDIFFFSNGCLVMWGFPRKFEREILEIVRNFAVEPLDKIEKDQFIVRAGNATKIKTQERFNVDIIELEEDSNVQLQLAISYGLAQSIKLESYEEAIQKTIQHNESIYADLTKKGKIRLSGRAISKRMGEIFIERSSVNLSGEYLDMPEYFWQYPSLEMYYNMTVKFLDVPRRVASLNHKLDVLHELFDMLTSQLQHRHSSMLETIIILLIFIEIVISVFFK